MQISSIINVSEGPKYALSFEILWDALREKCLYLEFFWSVFPHIRMFEYSVQLLENVDQKNSKYGHFSRSDSYSKYYYYLRVCS